MPSARQQFGQQAEDRAADFLQQKGYRIIDRHLTSRYGEIDILAKDGDTIVAVEVKARRNRAFGRAIEGLTLEKLERLVQALDDILDKRGLASQPTRIDLITVEPEGLDHIVGVE